MPWKREELTVNEWAANPKAHEKPRKGSPPPWLSDARDDARGGADP